MSEQENKPLGKNYAALAGKDGFDDKGYFAKGNKLAKGTNHMKRQQNMARAMFAEEMTPEKMRQTIQHVVKGLCEGEKWYLEHFKDWLFGKITNDTDERDSSSQPPIQIVIESAAINPIRIQEKQNEDRTIIDVKESGYDNDGTASV